MIYVAIIILFILGMLIRGSAKELIQKLIDKVEEKNRGRH